MKAICIMNRSFDMNKSIKKIMILTLGMLFIWQPTMANQEMADQKLEIEKFCKKSKWDGNYKINFKTKNNANNNSDSAWYSHEYNSYSLSFTNQKDCEQEGVLLLSSLNQKSSVLCGCETKLHVGLAFNKGENWYYQNVNCLKVSEDSQVKKLIKSRSVIRGAADRNTESNPALFYDQIREGQNYSLCVNTVLPELRESLKSK